MFLCCWGRGVILLIGVLEGKERFGKGGDGYLILNFGFLLSPLFFVR